ncbi:MAG: helix-turn-helix transcriptional regulator [Gemmatimonadota bacterium]
MTLSARPTAAARPADRFDSDVNHVLFRSGSVRVGSFRCPVHHPVFPEGPPPCQMVAFPRSEVWIERQHDRPFVADRRVVTLYNRGDRYRREAISREGDRTDWFGVKSALALEIATALDPGVGRHADRPFRFSHATSDPALYLRQQLLIRRLESGAIDPLEVEEEVVGIVAETLARAYAERGASPARRRFSEDEHRGLADRSRVELARDIGAPLSVAELARQVGVSPFHLCRVFRAQTGTTLHAYRTDLRLHRAVELLLDSCTELSELAFSLGFSSHSHFTETFRKRVGVTPSAVRQRRMGPAEWTERRRA